MKKIRVTERFLSIQGEGIKQGTPSIFIRLWGCNLNCVWCDSKASWQYGKEDAEEFRDWDFLYDEIKNMIPRSMDPGAVDLVFTGGEPMLFVNDHLLDVIDEFYESCGDIYFETNGTVPINRLKYTLEYVKFNCSPKLQNSGIMYDKRINHAVLNKISKTYGSCFKFVINSYDDIGEIRTIQSHAKIPTDMIYLMPEGVTKTEIGSNLKTCAELSKKYGYRVSNRMQVQVWGKTMGV